MAGGTPCSYGPAAQDLLEDLQSLRKMYESQLHGVRGELDEERAQAVKLRHQNDKLEREAVVGRRHTVVIESMLQQAHESELESARAEAVVQRCGVEARAVEERLARDRSEVDEYLAQQRGTADEMRRRTEAVWRSEVAAEQERGEKVRAMQESLNYRALLEQAQARIRQLEFERNCWGDERRQLEERVRQAAESRDICAQKICILRRSLSQRELTRYLSVVSGPNLAVSP